VLHFALRCWLHGYHMLCSHLSITEPAAFSSRTSSRSILRGITLHTHDIASSTASDSVPQVGIASHHASPSLRIAADTSLSLLRRIAPHHVASHSTAHRHPCMALHGIATLPRHRASTRGIAPYRPHARHCATMLLRSIAQHRSCAALRDSAALLTFGCSSNAASQVLQTPPPLFDRSFTLAFGGHLLHTHIVRF
jgi:hypothetical protein